MITHCTLCGGIIDLERDILPDLDDTPAVPGSGLVCLACSIQSHLLLRAVCDASRDEEASDDKQT